MLAPLHGHTASVCLLPDLSTHLSLSFSRPGDPVDVSAAVPGAGTGFGLDSGIGPCLPPGRPVGSCQCCPGLRLFETALLSLYPWSTNQEWQVRRGSISCCGVPPLGPQTMQSLYPPQASSDGTVCTNLRAQLHRLWWGPGESQSHHWTQLLREKHISQTGEGHQPGCPTSPSPLTARPNPLLPPQHMSLSSEGQSVFQDRTFHGHKSLDQPPNRSMRSLVCLYPQP